MTTLLKTAAAVTFALAATAAQANVVDLGIGGANLFSLDSFSASSSDVEGSVLVAGSMSASNYSVNDKNKDAFSGNNGHGIALAVGGALNYSSGSITHGTIYVGGAKSLSSVGTNGSTTISTAPVDFNALSASVKSTSANLSKLAATGSVTTTQYGGMTLKGTGAHKAVEVFNINGSDLSRINDFSFSGIDNNATLIINVSGTNAIGFNQNGVSLDGFKHYNVLYNFYQSTSLNIQNVGVEGSILAPLARVTGAGGHIDGEVVVGNWASNVQVNAQNFFKATNVQGFGVSPVPEADSYAMLLAGLAVVGVVARRKQRA